MLKYNSMCLSHGMDDKLAEILLVEIKGKMELLKVIVRVCYKPPDQEEQVDEALYRQMGADSNSEIIPP